MDSKPVVLTAAIADRIEDILISEGWDLAQSDKENLEALADIATGKTVCIEAEELAALREFFNLFEPFDGFAMSAGENPSVTERANALLAKVRASRPPMVCIEADRLARIEAALKRMARWEDETCSWSDRGFAARDIVRAALGDPNA